MKKLPLLFCSLFSFFFFSCKKEVNEPQTVKKIERFIVKNDIPKETFSKEVLPLIKELHEVDSVKYQMLNHIANKAEKETNKEIYKINIQNLEDALKYVK